MASFGKPNAKGRSSGKLTGRDKKVFGPPQGEQWSWRTVEMMQSDAWRALGLQGRRLLDFLELDHRAHASLCNGALKATYAQLAAFGISRRKISAAIDEAERLGFIEVDRGGRYAMTNRPSVYRLTYYADQHGNEPTNDWRRFSRPTREKQNRPTESGTTVVPPGGTTNTDLNEGSNQKTAEIVRLPNRPVVPPGGTASISPRDTRQRKKGKKTESIAGAPGRNRDFLMGGSQ